MCIRQKKKKVIDLSVHPVNLKTQLGNPKVAYISIVLNQLNLQLQAVSPRFCLCWEECLEVTAFLVLIVGLWFLQ